MSVRFIGDWFHGSSVVCKRNIGPDKSKIEAVTKARRPETVPVMRSFLGLVNFCARFIPDLGTLSEPLRKLTRQNVKFFWGQKRGIVQKVEREVDKCRNPRLLRHRSKIQLVTDASPVGLGAVLLQIQNGEKQIISYASRSLTDVEKRYSQTEKEALGIIWVCERFPMYLYGIDFELFTDHKPLEYIYSAKSKPSARIRRWVLCLQPYRFKVVYIKGKDNIADPLSRLTQMNERRVVQTDTEDFVKLISLFCSKSDVYQTDRK